ncbi:MAG: tRNA (adenosine(37)-N6)-threonylcarbamoyltransferase complex dimerization subunit type 1 TsaB [Candidatus Obscuribacterales bacterium]|nr:tRNA (adenosine(37)-N6)-threonylcarbamoyltransferase complex dimerization subunit type 1 TsaB [Candidatus Obscuribacterales bacterium]
MKILSFSTSGMAIQLALLDGERLILERSCMPQASNRQESASMLLPTIDEAIKEVGWSQSSLDLIVVDIGPGSFTGVRVSVVTARTLGQGLNLPVAGISTLEAMAYGRSRPCFVAMHAGPGKFFLAAFADSAKEVLAPLRTAAYGGIEELKAQRGELDLIVDQGAAEALAQAGIPCQIFAQNIATEAAFLAYNRVSLQESLGNGEFSRSTLTASFPWQSVVPLYLRNPSVTLKKHNGIAHTPNDPS